VNRSYTPKIPACRIWAPMIACITNYTSLKPTTWEDQPSALTQSTRCYMPLGYRQSGVACGAVTAPVRVGPWRRFQWATQRILSTVGIGAGHNKYAPRAGNESIFAEPFITSSPTFWVLRWQLWTIFPPLFQTPPQAPWWPQCWQSLRRLDTNPERCHLIPTHLTSKPSLELACRFLGWRILLVIPTRCRFCLCSVGR
jgi:hypothetical protein